MDTIRSFSKKQIIGLVILVILMVSIPIGVFLVQKTQIFKSKASSFPVLDAFEIKDADGNTLICDANTNPPTCTTSIQEVTIKVKDLDAFIPK